MYGMSVQQAIFNYSSSVIQGMQKYTKINSSNGSFSETLSKIDSAKSSGKKRIQPEESTVDKYISKHKDRKADVDKMVSAGENVIKQYLGENYNPDDLTLEEYKSLINDVISKIPYDSSQLNDVEYINITEDGYKQMKSDPKYEAWVLGYFKIDRAVHFPIGAQGHYHAEHFGASIEEHHGEGYPLEFVDYKDDESWWEKRQKRHDMLMGLMEKYYEKRHMEREAATKKNAERMIASDAFSLFGAKGVDNVFSETSYLGGEISAAEEFFMMMFTGTGNGVAQ
ncbi:hypothetical protein [Pseudobutyrivibrio sp.]